MKAFGKGPMKESYERMIKVGLTRGPKAVFDEVESVTAETIRRGFTLRESFIEEGLGNIHLIFEREIIHTNAVDMSRSRVDN
jgi:hypothetical protein